MKKILFMAIAIVLGMSAVAQNKKISTPGKTYLGFSVGLAIPIGDFSSTNLEKGGFAKTGFNANLYGGYYFSPRVGIGGNIAYASYGVNSGAIGIQGLSADHWQYYTFTAGPIFNLVQKERVDWTLNVFGGLGHANSPVATYETSSTKDLWASAFALQIGTGVRFMTSPKTFLMANLDYLTMKPKWSDATTGDYEQSMAGLHLNVGLGWKF